MKKLVLILLVAWLLTACSVTRNAMDSWLGSTKQELIKQWGPPDRIASDGGTGEVLVYVNEGYWPGINGQGAYAYWDYKYMYVDIDKKIYSWKTKRERIPPTQIDLNLK